MRVASAVDCPYYYYIEESWLCVFCDAEIESPPKVSSFVWQTLSDENLSESTAALQNASGKVYCTWCVDLDVCAPSNFDKDENISVNMCPYKYFTV